MRITVMKCRLRLTVAAWASLAVPLAAQAQGYPSRPIRSIMTVAGGADVVARLVAQGLTGALAAGFFPFVVADLLKLLVAAGVMPGLWWLTGRRDGQDLQQ